MEVLAAIVGKITEYTVSPVIRQVGYVISYNKNVKKLRRQVEDLVNARESVRHSVDVEERNNKRVVEDVESWLTGVDEITKEANTFLSGEQHAEVKCFHGFCPNLKLRHQLSRKSTKLALDVGELYTKKDFTRFAYEVPLQEMTLIAPPDYETFDSRTSIVKEVIDELKKSSTYMIGVYGIGGVGKTTLVREIYRQATTGEKLFEEVVMVLDLKHNPSIRRIQKEIAENLGLGLSETDTDAGRARQVCNRIKDKRTLVILDDVWESIDLKAVGLPRMATLKVLLTSRTRQVLSSEMGTQTDFPLLVLDKEESWILFEKEVGNVVKDPNIGTVATRVAEKCGGLPLLIVTVARYLKYSSLPDWRTTLRQLERLDGQGLTEKTNAVIEWSYNRLESKELKSVFLLCACEARYRGGNSILMLDLLKYSMGLGFLSNVQTMDEAYDALHSMIEKLKWSCLLLASDGNKWVTMHDLVKDVAKHIALRDHMVLSLSHGSELREWPDNEFCEKYSMISLIDCSIPQFPEVLRCQELKLFILGRIIQSSFQEIPGDFFREMKKLRVLDLTELSMPSLPPSLQFLISLRTLCLDQCTLGDLSLVGELRNLEILSLLRSKFKQLPKEIGQLTRLRLLDLSNCTQLEVISPNVLSRLTRLEQLRMGDSFNKWESEGGINTERHNVNIEELKHLTQLTALQIHIPDANILPPNLFTNHKLQRYQVCIGSAWKWTDVDEDLNTLKLQLTSSNELDQGLIKLLKSTKDLYLEGIDGVNNSILSQVGIKGIQHLKHLHVQNHNDVAYMVDRKIGFPNLTWLAISDLKDTKFMLSSSMARCLVQLERLQISNCRSMEYIISLEESDEESIGIIFLKLQDLDLKDLPNLLKFYSRNDTKVQTPPIERLEVEVCTQSDIICEEIAETDSKGNTHFLFDDKVGFPNLRKLSIHGSANLTTIWKNHCSLESSNNLETVEIDSCKSLKCVFPALVDKSLQQLRSLKVKNCGVAEIIFNKDKVLTTHMFVFPKLTYVEFQNLPQLRSFYPGSHAFKFPSLVTLLVYRCQQVVVFANGKPELYNRTTPNKQFLFLLEKDSFPSLEILGLNLHENGDNPPLHLFRNLKQLYTHVYGNSSINSLEELLGLEEVDASNREILAVGDGTLSQLRQLHLHRMRKLRHLGEANSQSTSACFPNLEFLVLDNCDSLMNLRSSAISFNNLKTLKVSSCKGLKYLISYSIAKRLMHLTSLEVEDCEEMIEIVQANEDGYSRSDIEFNRLKYLKLSALPRLQAFCSGNVLLKFSSLETLSLNCTTLETFIFAPINKSCTIGKEIRETGAKENLESGGVPVTKFLFDKKVGLPNLKSLSIYGLTMLTTIWHSELASDSFCQLKDLDIRDCDNLVNIFVPSIMEKLSALDTLSIKMCKSLQLIFAVEGAGVKDRIQDTSKATQLKSISCVNLSSVEIDSCESLKNVFPAWVARNLQQLKSLIVKTCGVEQIIAKEEGLQTTPKFVFPKVTKVDFFNLARLTNFYPEIHASCWPSLNDVRVIRCEKVNIFGMEGMEGVNNGILSQISIEGIQHLKHLHVQNHNDVAYMVDRKIGFPNLTWLAISELKDTKFMLSSSMARCLVQLERLQISNCRSMEYIISLEESDEESIGIIFLKLQDLELKDLPNLHKFYSQNDTKVQTPPMERLEVEVCTQSDIICEEIAKTDSKGNTHFLFDDKVGFPNLRKLSIHGSANLTTIWKNHCSLESSNNLETVEIDSCKSLKCVFPALVDTSLQQLRSLKVKNCGVEEIIFNKDKVLTTPMFVFPKLTYVRFKNLPQLRSFYPGSHAFKFPSLVTLLVYTCQQVVVFANGKPELYNRTTPNKQFLFLLEKDLFPSLEILGLNLHENGDNPPLHLFRNLKKLYTYAFGNSSINSLEELLGLEEVDASNREILAVGDGTLSQLRQLHLYRMRKLRHLGEANS